MKKILCLFSALTLVLTSCSSDDENAPVEENLLLPKTEKYSYSSNPDESSIVTYKYDGNKIVSLSYDGEEQTNFTYTGNLITKAVYVESYGEGTRTRITTFTYEKNKLKSSLQTNSENAVSVTKTYTYNVNGTISTVSVVNDPTLKKESVNSSSVITLDANGNITKVEVGNFSDTFEYDTKYNPFKNILGYTALLDSDIFDREVNSVNNMTKVTERTDGVIVGTTTHENTYNSDNYLIKSVSGDETFEYTY
jgi:hypothetical protein